MSQAILDHIRVYNVMDAVCFHFWPSNHSMLNSVLSKLCGVIYTDISISIKYHCALIFFMPSQFFLCVCLSLGLLPWNAVPGKACGMTLSNVCKTREVRFGPRQCAIQYLLVIHQKTFLKALSNPKLRSNILAAQ